MEKFRPASHLSGYHAGIRVARELQPMPQTFSESDRHAVDTIVADQLAATGAPGAIVGVWLPE
jgi:hypothetical protein